MVTPVHTVESTREAPSLLQRVAAGESEAVQLLLDRYGPLVWSVARKQVEAHAAEDVVQEIFIQLWKNAHRYDPALGSEATFITTIARRRLIDHRRRVGRRPDTEELEEHLPEETSRFEDVDLADEARVAAQALEQLRPEQRRVLQLAVVDGLTHSQISAVTRLPLGTVKSHARRGLERVRELLQTREAKRGGGAQR